jgi:hypothetical protein
MHPMETDRLIDDYLRRLEHAAAHMQRARRAELVAEIRGHIETALRQEQAVGEAAVRNVLDRLGPPEEIVEAEPPSPPGDRRTGVLEIVALLALIVPFIGWLIGIVLVFASRVWSRRDKLIGALLLFGPILLLSVGFTVAGPSGSEESVSPGHVEEPAVETTSSPGPAELGLVLFVAGLPSALYLGWQLRRDPAARSTES